MNINATLIGQSITFLIFVWFCMKYIWPYIMRALAERNKRIADGLAAAERGNRDLELATERSADVVREAKQQASEIITQAEKRGVMLIEEAKANAKMEGSRLVAGAKAEIEQEVFRARDELRNQVAALAVAGAEKILRREVDASTHSDLLTAIKAEL